MDKIVRFNTVMRGDYEMVYPFTTYSLVFEWEKMVDPALSCLCAYIADVFVNGTPKDGRESISSLGALPLKSEYSTDCDIVDLCKRSNYQGKGKKQHETVQEYFMQYDPHTIAIEVPVYTDKTHGHIDLIRYVDGKIQILDFKPGAAKEKKADAQVYRYRMALTERLENIIPRLGVERPEMVQIECYYFDENICYKVLH